MRSVRISIIIAGTSLLLAGVATAKPTAETTVVSGDRTVQLRLSIWDRNTIYMHTEATDPHGLFPYCVTLRLEKRTESGWRGIGKGSGRTSRDCFADQTENESGSATTTHWDNFVYPRGRLAKRFKSGKLRAHGFTNLGGDVAFRW